MVDYNSLKKAVEEYGEVMIRIETGEKLELHKHNVKFNDFTKEIIVDAATATYWIDVDKVSYYWIHKEGIGKE